MKLNLEIDSKRIIPWVIVLVLVVLLVWSLKVDSGEPTIVEKQTTDTIVVTKVDTLTITDVRTVIKPVHDTTYVTYRDSIYVPVPRQDYNFSEEGVFDITVRGFDVEFLSAEVYPKTVYKTITNTVETTIYKDSWNLYFGAGIWAFNKETVPTLNLTLKTPKRWLISLNTGYYGGRLIYGGQISYKILGK